MDSDHSAEDSPHENPSKTCPICHQALELSEPAPICILCNKKTCDSCSIIQGNQSFRYCCKCSKFLPFLPPSTIQQLQLETLTNIELTSKLSSIQEELTKGFQKFKVLDEELDSIEEKKFVIETMTNEVSENVKKIHEITADIKMLTAENSEMDSIIKEKEDRIEFLNKELSKIKNEAAESKVNSNSIPPECCELFQENQELKGKLKEMESEQISYTQQMIDSLEILKAQLIREKGENCELRTVADSGESEEMESVEREKKRIVELQEELRITKRQLELMRGSKMQSKGVARTGREAKEDLGKKKCEVF